jgi:hypothetical protein
LNANAARCLRQIKTYWPLVLILIVVIIVSFIIIYSKVSSPPLFVYYFGETKTLGNSSGNAFSPQIATSGNDTYIVWSDKGPVKGVINMEKISSNNGRATSPVSISNNSSNSTYTQVAVSGDNVYVVWADSNVTKGGNGDIFFSSSRDKGKSFDEPVNLSNNSGNSTNPEVAASGNNVYVIWADNEKGGNGDVFLSSSRDKGKSFDEPVNLSNNSGNSTNPEVAASGNNVYVVWAESSSKKDTSDGVNLLLKTSTDNGTHFTKKTIKKDIDKKTHLPQIAASGDNVYVVLADKDPKEGQPDNFRVILKTSTDNGTHFTNRKSIDKDIDKKTHLPQIAASGDNVYVVWADSNGTKGEHGNISFSSSRDKGKSFDEPVNLSNNSGNSTNPEVAVSGNNTYVMWSDSSSEKKDIKYKHIKLVMLRP